MKKINIILNLKKIKKISEICIIVLVIFAWLFSGWPQIWNNPPIPSEIQKARAAPGAMDFKKGSFAKATTAGNQEITGVGFQPKTIIFYWTNQTAEGISDTGYYGMGFTSGSTAERAISSWSDAGKTSLTGRKGSETYCIMIQLATGADGGTAELSAFGADGFTLNWVTADANAYIIHYIALAGSDLTNAQAGTFDLTTTLGSQAVTGVGFQPEFVMFLSAAVGTTYNTNTVHSRVSSGFATDATNEGSVAFGIKNAAANSDSYFQQRIDHSILLLTVTNTQDALVEFTSMDVDGFTVNKLDAPAVTTGIFYLALKGGQYKVGNFTQATATGEQQTTGVGFQPVGLFMESGNKVAGTAIIPDANHSIGATQSSTARGTICSIEEDGDVAPDPDTHTVTTKAIRMAGGTASAVTAEADFVSFNADGFTLNWTTADATAIQIIYWAIGPEPTALSITVGDGTIAFGSLNLGATASTTIAGGGLADHQTATNTSSVIANINIMGANSTGGYWTLSGAIGENIYTMDVCTTTCETAPHWKALNNAGYIDLKENVAVDNSVDNGTDFDLKIIVPDIITGADAKLEQSIVITVQIE